MNRQKAKCLSQVDEMSTSEVLKTIVRQAFSYALTDLIDSNKQGQDLGLERN